MHMSTDGIILNSNANTPNFEKGYFVGGAGLGEDEFLHVGEEALVPRQEPAVELIAKPLE